MKRLLLCAAVFMAAAVFNKANAQNSTSLSVSLTDIQSIVVNNPTVALNFTTPLDYSAGVTKAQANHLTVTSTGKFIVKVRAGGTHLTGGTTGDAIPVSSISLTPTLAGTPFGVSTPTTIDELSDQDQDLYENSLGTTASNINVSYKASGGENYLNRTGTFTTTLTYTIVPE